MVFWRVRRLATAWRREANCSGLRATVIVLRATFCVSIGNQLRERMEGGAVQHRFPADVTDVGPDCAAVGRTAGPGPWGAMFFSWRFIFTFDVKQSDKYIYLSMKKTPLSSRPGALSAWPRSKPPSKNARSQPLPYLQGLFGPWVSKECSCGPAATRPRQPSPCLPLGVDLLGFLEPNPQSGRQLPGSGAPGLGLVLSGGQGHGG